MILHRAGREYVRWAYDSNVALVAADVYLAGAWRTATITDTDIVLLVSGPDTTGFTPEGTVVLALGTYHTILRFSDGIELVVRDGGTINVVDIVTGESDSGSGSWPLYTVTDLALYTGRPDAAFTSYTNVALNQAMLLFKIYTCLTTWPTDVNDRQLAEYAVLSMADSFVLSQPYSETLGSPFQSETIGSYSYSKAQRQLAAGLPTGISWFDLAIQQLGICELSPNGGIATDSINVFEADVLMATGDDGRRRVLGPADIIMPDIPYYISLDPQP